MPSTLRTKPSRWPGGSASIGLQASVFRYPLNVRHPVPLDGGARRDPAGSGPAAPSTSGSWASPQAGTWPAWRPSPPGARPRRQSQFAVLGYAITSMETETYRPSRLILLGQDASPELRRSTSLDALVTPGSPPFFIWHTAQDPYVPPEHSYRLARGAGGQQRTPHGARIRPRPAQPRPGPRRRRRGELDGLGGRMDP